MPLSSACVGASTAPITHNIDARWLMAYAAGISDDNPRYADPVSHQGLAVHPLFPVCFEWPVILASRELPGSEQLTNAERGRGVHASHDLHWHSAINEGDQLTTTSTVIGVEQRKPGAFQMTRLDTVNQRQQLVCRTYQGSLLRDVHVAGGDRWLEPAPPPPAFAADATSLAPSKGEVLQVQVPMGAAHVYTECARIWNPIHTDRRVALAAGLPDIILHGTATLAMAVTCVVDHCLQREAQRVTRIGCRFSAMVLMPSVLTVQLMQRTETALAFRVLNPDRSVAVDRGFVAFA